MKPVGVLRFLGTNCDEDVFKAVAQVGLTPHWIWYEERFAWTDYKALILPGGFSHGDYLRSGALAAKAPVMASVYEAAQKGVPILGICNGFQILCEANLLPGTLVRNNGLRFVDRWTTLRRVGRSADFVAAENASVHLPIAHGDGRYFVEEDQSKRLFDAGQVWWQYENNPNGSVENIAGVLNETGNVAGLMPHPERAMAHWMGGADGVSFFSTLM